MAPQPWGPAGFSELQVSSRTTLVFQHCSFLTKFFQTLTPWIFINLSAHDPINGESLLIASPGHLVMKDKSYIHNFNSEIWNLLSSCRHLNKRTLPRLVYCWERLAGQLASMRIQACLVMPATTCIQFVDPTMNHSLIPCFAGPETQCCQSPWIGYMTHIDWNHSRPRFWRRFSVILRSVHDYISLLTF